MPLTKRFLKTKPLCKVRFDFLQEQQPEAREVELVGSFNNWEPVAMRKVKGGFTRSLDLPKGESFEFRYRINGELWENDAEADAYAANAFAAENSVVYCR